MCFTGKFLNAENAVFEKNLYNSPNNEIQTKLFAWKSLGFGLVIPLERKRAWETINRRLDRAKVCDGIVRWPSGYLYITANYITRAGCHGT
jgi:hypothetical protein